MVSSVSEASKTYQHKIICHCFNRDCPQPENIASALNCVSCGADLLLKNRYRALKLIGQGGFGRTFKGVDESHSSRPYCAIKQFWVSPNSPSMGQAIALFQQEAQRLATLGTHEQIPALIEHVVVPENQYLVQEFIPGDNLAQVLAQQGAWDEAGILDLLQNILPLLQFVHRHQVIHRDIKPENIIRQDDGSLTLVDFGAAKLVTDATLGRTGTVIGSAAFTAPEQVKGKAVFASDLYSLGVTCIYLLTQVSPFDLFDSGDHGWKWRHFLTQPVSDRTGKVLDQLLAVGLNQRYLSAAAVQADLQKPLVKKRPFRRALLVAGVAVLALSGVRALVSPLVNQVSTVAELPSVQETPDSFAEGGLYGYSDAGESQAFPLEHTDVTAKISGNLSRVEVTQTFTNPYDSPLEAVYKFPLPEDVAVDDMEIRIGDRIIRGLIKEREAAKAIYTEAKQKGQTAGLLEQQRANVFTQSLANIQPGEKIDVVIRYSNSLAFKGGDYEFVFPMVVGPRYRPGDTAQGRSWGIEAAFASAEGRGQTRSGHDIDVAVEIDAGVEIADVRSPSHAIFRQDVGTATRVQLTNEETIPNKDLILRYQVTGAETQATVLTQSNEQGGHFSTYLIPAVEYDAAQIVPKDVVFLVDTSGSQAGPPIAQSKALMRQFISGLNEDDTFTIIDFSNTAQMLSSRPLRNTRRNRAKALSYIDQLDANGGTEMMNGINTVLGFPAAEAGRLRSIVLVSDGLIGNDEAIIGRVRDGLAPGNRLYSFGVGSSTNRFVLDRLAEVGRGTVAIVPPAEPAVDVAEQFFREINNPVVTDIEVSWLGEGDAPEMYPQRSPDLYASQPLVLHGRKADRRGGQLLVTGKVAGGKPYEQVLDVRFDQVSGNGAIAQQWGRSRIKDLMNQMYGRENPDGVAAVTATALDYRLLSKYTAFVAVTEAVRVNPDARSLSADVPLETPEGMNNASVPEPSEIIGNLIAILFLVLFFTRKRWHRLTLALVRARR